MIEEIKNTPPPEGSAVKPAAPSVPEIVKSNPRTPKKASADALPCDIDTEKSLLSAIFQDASNMDIAMSVLDISDIKGAKPKKKGDRDSQYISSVASTIFREPVHSAVYEAMLFIYQNNQKIDVLSVADYLKKTQRLDAVGGMETLLSILDFAASTAHFSAWCTTIKDYAMLREMMRTCTSSLELCRQGSTNIKDLLDTVESEIFNVRNRFIQPEIKELHSIVKPTLEKLLAINNREVDPGIKTGYVDLDRLVSGGLKPGEMFVIAARPSIGKTAFALNIVRNIILREEKKSVLFFSLEMSEDQITQRLISTESQIPLSAFYGGQFQNADMPKLVQAAGKLSKAARLYIDPTPGISLYELRAKARKEKSLHNIDLIVIDYLQLMKATGHEDNRQVEVATISGGLKGIAKELNVPVLALAQLNRETEKLPSGKANQNAFPKLSNLRESGAIEQDADVVCFLHRNRDEAKEGAKKASGEAIDPKELEAYVIVEKNRNGKTGIVKLQFVAEIMEFRSVEHKYDGNVPKANQ